MNDDWIYNYFNYFTEIEEHFQRARGTSLFLLSPLDWALVESWKNAGVPLEAVLRGIDAAFEKWRGRKKKTQHGEFAGVLRAGRADGSAGHGRNRPRPAAHESAPPFPLDDLRDYLARNAAALRQAGVDYDEIAAALERLAAEAETHYHDLEDLERRLTVLEEKAIAAARNRQSEEQLLDARRELDRATPALSLQDDAPNIWPCWKNNTWSATCWKGRACRG